MTPTPTTLESLGFRRSLMARLRTYFFAGVLVTAPIAITIYVAWSVITAVDDMVANIIPPAYNPNTYLPFNIPGIGLLLLVITMTLIGFLTANYLGRIIVRIGERVVGTMPIVRSLYGAVKQIFESVLRSDRARSFRDVVLVEFPRKDMWTLGLVIGETYGEVLEKTGKRMCNVYLPTTPNPTSGYLVFVPDEDIIRLDMKVDDCMKMIVSGGIVTPPYVPRVPKT